MNQESRPRESYEDFLERIFSFENPNFTFGLEKFEPSGSVVAKVDADGKFSRFVGDTVVFDLEPLQKRFIQTRYIEPLYRVAPECFAEKFHESTLHMTLHDLNASVNDDVVMHRVFETEIRLAQKLREATIKPERINMVTTCVFNMVNTSLVLGLKPKTQEDYDKLMWLYYFVEDICQLPYPLTPHITLAYYGRNGFAGERIESIEKVVNELNCSNFEITLSMDRLYYQKFLNMNEFFNIMSFTK